MTDRLTLVFLIDALGYAQANSPQFLPSCTVTRRPVRSVLGYSSAAIPTLLSGRTPAAHGHLAMYRRARADSVLSGVGRAMGAASRWTGRHWTLRRLTARWLRARGVTGYFALYEIPLPWLEHFDLCQRRDLFAPGAFAPQEGLADLAGRSGSARLWNWSVPEEQAFRELEGEIEKGSKRFLLLYTSALDGLMHAAGPNGAAVPRLLASYSERIERLRALAASRYREVRLFAFGDHGMAQVTTTRDLWASLEQIGLRVPRDYLFFLDSTMARFWFHRDDARRRVESLLRGLGYGRIVEPDELKALDAWFPNSDYGELIFLLPEGEIFVPSFMSKERVEGMHGYHPDAPSAYTTLVTNAADISYPEDLAGIYRVLASELGVPSPARPGDRIDEAVRPR